MSPHIDFYCVVIRGAKDEEAELTWWTLETALDLPSGKLTVCY